MERSFENVVLEVDAVDGYLEWKETAEVYSSYFYKSYSSNHTRKSTIELVCKYNNIFCYYVDYKNRYYTLSTVPNVYLE